MCSTEVTLSDVAKAVTELEVERRRLYAASFSISKAQRESVTRFQKEMAEHATEQRVVAERLVALEVALQKLLTPLCV